MIKSIIFFIFTLLLIGCDSSSETSSKLKSQNETISEISPPPPARPPVQHPPVIPPTQTQCSENGVTAQVHEIKRFYRIQQGTCLQTCDNSSSYVDKICQTDGTFRSLRSPAFALETYRYSSCISANPSSCQSTGGGTIGSSFEQPGCQAPTTSSMELNWSGIYGSSWPTYNRWIRLTNSTSLISLQFTTSSNPTQFGTFSSADYPGEGAHGSIVLGISKTPGCIDPSKLPARCVMPASYFAGISWSNHASAYTCNLRPGETYYLNIFWGTTAPHSSGAICPLGGEGNGACGRDFLNYRQ